MAKPKTVRSAKPRRQKKSKAVTVAEKLEELRPVDRAALLEMRARSHGRVDAPRAEVVVENGELAIRHHPKQDDLFFAAALGDAMGTRSEDFLNNLSSNLVLTLAPKGNVTEQQYNAALAVLAAIGPTNEAEAVLAGQMLAANEGAMRCTRAMFKADMVPQFQMYGNLANKFMRTFTAQMEALAKLRRGGEQIVRHVHVYEGGQAVVAGTINQHKGGGGFAKDGGQSDGANAIAGGSALPCPDPARDGMPIPGDAERALSNARGNESGRPAGE